MKQDKTQGRFTPAQLRIAGAAAVTAVLLLVIGILGNVRISGYVKSSMEESIHRAESEIAVRERQESLEAAKVEETAVHEIELTYMEEQLLILLEGKLSGNDYEGAARVLNENEEAFRNLFFSKLADKTCLFDGQVMTDKADGRGIVFQKAGTVFYGSFKDGRPSGPCTAIQAISLEEGVRYDYSAGIWADGVMEGEGECGYDYYEGISGDGAKKTIKRGMFSDDLMEGDITYTSVSGEGESTSWSMTVADGVIVPDERWVSDTADGETPIFRLMADTDDVHAYVVKADDMKEVRWKNMIKWGE